MMPPQTVDLRFEADDELARLEFEEVSKAPDLGIESPSRTLVMP